MGVPQQVLGTVNLTELRTGDPSYTTRSLHDNRRVPEIQRGLVAWLSFGADAHDACRLTCNTTSTEVLFGLVRRRWEIASAKGKVAMQCAKTIVPFAQSTPSPRFTWSLEISTCHCPCLEPHISVDCTRENPSGLAVRPCVSITRAVSLRTET